MSERQLECGLRQHHLRLGDDHGATGDFSGKRCLRNCNRDERFSVVADAEPWGAPRAPGYYQAAPFHGLGSRSK